MCKNSDAQQQVTGERLDDQAVRVVNAIVVHGRI